MIFRRKFVSPRRVEDRVREELHDLAQAGVIHAVMDGARIRGLRVLLRELGVQSDCLAARIRSQDLTNVAPFVAKLQLTDDLFELFRLRPEVVSASLFLKTDVDLPVLRRHLKRFLMVDAPDGSTVFFRYYDPRIFGPFWSACHDGEIAALCDVVSDFAGRNNDDEMISSDPALLRWRPEIARDTASAPDVAPTTPLPTASRRFQLRDEHQEALRADAVRRYERRVVEYLRSRGVGRGRLQETELIEVVHRAKGIASHLGLAAGCDITRLAEAMALGGGSEARRTLPGLAPELRRASLIDLCERLSS